MGTSHRVDAEFTGQGGKPVRVPGEIRVLQRVGSEPSEGPGARGSGDDVRVPCWALQGTAYSVGEEGLHWGLPALQGTACSLATLDATGYTVRVPGAGKLPALSGTRAGKDAAKSWVVANLLC